jgi:hypothetical protein
MIEGIFEIRRPAYRSCQLSVSQSGAIAYLPGRCFDRRFFMGFSDRSGKIERLNVPIGALKFSHLAGRKAYRLCPISETADGPAAVWPTTSGNKALRRLTYAGAFVFLSGQPTAAGRLSIRS